MSTPVSTVVTLGCYSLVALELRGDVVGADHETEGHDGAKVLERNTFGRCADAGRFVKYRFEMEIDEDSAAINKG